jgi:beta-lactam-binding protein with PASTA domain
LEAIGLTMGNFIQRTSREEPGTIVQQTPAAGTLAAPGTSITGWIARERIQ